MINNVEQVILMLVAAYLLGSIPSGVWIGKAFFHIDIRRHGSRILASYVNLWGTRYENAEQIAAAFGDTPFGKKLDVQKIFPV